MSWNNKVVWSEGMFMRPQHFQQHDRYLEGLIEGRASALCPYSWGLTELKLDEALLGLGKVGIATARGILPDGTPFNIPADEDPPLAIEFPAGLKDCRVLLALPLRRPGMEESDREERSDGLARFRIGEHEARDSNLGMDASALLEIGKLRLRLVLERDDLKAYACLGFARIVERRADNRLVVDAAFIPPALDCRVSAALSGFLKELLGLLHHRGEALAVRVGQPGKGGVAEIADFLLLQIVNRWEPWFAHLAAMGGLHPERFYAAALQAAGELATFTHPNKRPAGFPLYRHEDLEGSFAPLMADLRQSLSMVIERNAVPIPLEERKHGVRVAVIDKELLRSATFVLAVNARLPPETVRTGFPTQAKAGPVERITDLVNLQLPGIGLYALPVAPRQIPYHAGFTYFELDRNHEYWKQLEASGGFALHVAGKFPELALEFWALRA
jgi:type VI secretion system protein ImpJ